MLLWIDGAPVIGRNSDIDVLKWIEQRITCRIPDEKINPELHRLIVKYQSHKCSNYCKRKKKVKGTFITKCKFGFPRAETEEGVINSVEESLKSKVKVNHLPCSSTEVKINDYNPIILLIWKANMDIQYVADSTLAIAHYVTGYVTKAEISHMQETFADLIDHHSLYSKLWSFGVPSLRHRECGLYESADLLLGNHLCSKSESVEWISVEHPSKRKHRIKKFNELKNLAQAAPHSTDLYESGLVDTFYPQRSNELEECCLYGFKKWYKFNGLDAQGKRSYYKLNKPILPNHKLYDPNKDEQREDFYYSLLLLFKPFRDESGLVKEGQTAEGAFREFLDTEVEMISHHDKLMKMLNAQSKVCNINEHRFENEENVTEEPVESPVITGEAVAAMNDVCDINAVNHIIDLDERIAKLNKDQSRIFHNLCEHFNHQYRHKHNQCVCNDFKPIHLFLSGVGGTGKSVVIETIRAKVAEIWKSDCNNDDVVCTVTAPTGLAAYIINGVTVHRLFQLPIEHEGKTAGYWSLPKESQKVMRANFRMLKLLIVDEVSMLSNLNLVIT